MTTKIISFPKPAPKEDHSVKAMVEQLRQARIKRDT